MKNEFLLLFLLSTFISVGCSKDSINDKSSFSTNNVNQGQLEDIAKIFTMVHFDESEICYVNSNVQTASDFGLDEEMYLSELWSNSEETKVSIL